MAGTTATRLTAMDARTGLMRTRRPMRASSGRRAWTTWNLFSELSWHRWRIGLVSRRCSWSFPTARARGRCRDSRDPPSNAGLASGGRPPPDSGSELPGPSRLWLDRPSLLPGVLPPGPPPRLTRRAPAPGSSRVRACAGHLPARALRRGRPTRSVRRRSSTRLKRPGPSFAASGVRARRSSGCKFPPGNCRCAGLDAGIHGRWRRNQVVNVVNAVLYIGADRRIVRAGVDHMSRRNDEKDGWKDERESEGFAMSTPPAWGEDRGAASRSASARHPYDGRAGRRDSRQRVEHRSRRSSLRPSVRHPDPRGEEDRRDARALAEACRLGAYRPAHRASDAPRHVRARLAVRDTLVRTRTRPLSPVRALLQQPGWQVPTGSAEHCSRRVLALPLPGRLRSDVAPLLAVMRQVHQPLASSDGWIAATMEVPASRRTGALSGGPANPLSGAA